MFRLQHISELFIWHSCQVVSQFSIQSQQRVLTQASYLRSVILSKGLIFTEAAVITAHVNITGQWKGELQVNR